MGEPTTTLLGFFLSAAGAFGKLLGWLSNEDRKNRDRIATYFDQIAACMREVAERIEAGDPPQDTCRRLAIYADGLQQILYDRNYIIAGGDVSAEETRQRLVREIKQTEKTWWQQAAVPARPAESARPREIVRKVKETAAYGSQSASKASIDLLAGKFEQEFAGLADVHESVQQIWNASGEFAALADVLRAR